MSGGYRFGTRYPGLGTRGNETAKTQRALRNAKDQKPWRHGGRKGSEMSEEL
jgi:hypothetical protein